MASRLRGGFQQHLQSLFGGGTVAGVTEAGLLARFLTRGDQAAFESLVARHGPMVLGVCRRVLSNPEDVEDAFQATFLVLVRKAHSLRDVDRLGPWLHGVAARVAVRARAQAIPRRAREGWGARRVTIDPSPALEWGDLRPVLDEELARLPERYRAAVVLCCLEGLGPEEAAQQLGCPMGTIKSRLAGGRERLRVRLTRRGLAPAAGLPLAMLSAEAARAAVPDALVASTVETATRLVAGTLAAAAVPASLSLLMQGGLKTMFLTRAFPVMAAVLLVGVATTCVGVLAQQGKPARPGDAKSERAVTKATSAAAPEAADDPQGIRALAESRRDLAREGYNDVFESLKNTRKSPSITGDEFMDRATTWSRRWMEAELDVSSNRSDQIAAREAHWQRLRKLEEDFAPHMDKEVGSRAFNALKFYRLEAEYGLAKAKAAL
jgi:RNA polymerase sigma factor (sigma-70 family)